MGAYLDRLNEQFDTITTGIDEILNRAADENRDVTEDEQKLVEREQAKAEDLKKSIEHYGTLEVTRSKVAEVRSKVPAAGQVQRERVKVDEPEKLEDLFPTAGHYATIVARALRGDREASQVIERAFQIVERDTTTKHQTTTDNPGIIPRPIVGPIITAVGNERPFIQSITNKPLPAGSFDRPHITQHVGVGKQAAEKQPTESRLLKIDKLPVSASTYAGHLNVSRQDVKWSSPAIMQILLEDFGHEYAVETDKDAVAQFEASLTAAPVAADTADAAGIRTAVFTAAAQIMGTADGAPLPDTLWVAPDVWGTLGSLTSTSGAPVFPSVTPTSSAGNPMGLRLVVDPWFTAGTMVTGPARYLEWFEDVDGFLSVAEPDVLGQLVGYAGYGAFLNTKPSLFVPITLPAAPALVAARTDKK